MNNANNGNAKNQSWDFDYISSPQETVLEKLKTSQRGLTDQEAQRRAQEYGLNEPAKRKKRKVLFQFLSKFANPLVIVLLIIAAFSLFFGEKIEALLVIMMAIMSVLLSFIQEYRAGKEAEKLSEMVRATATVYRNGKAREVKIREIVPALVVSVAIFVS